MSRTFPKVASWIQGTKIPAAAGAAEALVSGQTLVRFVRIRAMRAARVANTGSVFLGFTPGANTQLEELVPSEWQTYTAPPGEYIDLSLIYVDPASTGDGVIFYGIL